jgi:hypothetical protein
VNEEEVIKTIQQHFTDGLVLVVGSGLSLAEGIPGMPQLASYLQSSSSNLTGEDATIWANLDRELSGGTGLEAALLKHQATPSLESWISEKTCELLVPSESAVINAVMSTNRDLRLTQLLRKVLRTRTGLPILTTNYDRLIEVACEMAGLHVDTTATGHYAGSFDHEKSFMGACKGIVRVGKTTMLDHNPRAVVLKPHGSLDWYKGTKGAFRSSFALEQERLIITPGYNKYRAGYNVPFDKHRELANNYIDCAARLFIIGYGFNDDHLQQRLIPRIEGGTPTLILTRSASAKAVQLAKESPNCLCICKSDTSEESEIFGKNTHVKKNTILWDLENLISEIL